MKRKKFPVLLQHGMMDCGPTCLRMVARYYGKDYSLHALRKLMNLSREGVSLLDIASAAEKAGMLTRGIRIEIETLCNEVKLPIILHYNAHFIVVFKVSGRNENRTIHVADPYAGEIKYTLEEFSRLWATDIVDGIHCGKALLIEPAPNFNESELETSKKLGFAYMLRQILVYKDLLLQLLLGFVVGSVIQFILPITAQRIVDSGILNRDINVIYAILIGQSALLLGRLSVEVLRSWVLLHITSRVNLRVLSDYIVKLFRLPISFFETRMTGDIIQRLGDYARVQRFLTVSSIGTVFSFFNFIIFCTIVLTYSIKIFVIFVAFIALYFSWIFCFFGRRKRLDKTTFANSSLTQNTLIQLVSGAQDIKLNNNEKIRRWQWENLQIKQFRMAFRQLSINQTQQIGAAFLNEAKNIFITLFIAFDVIDGQITLGTMMAIQYIIGMLNGPIEQFIAFAQSWQDANLSIDRLNEIHELEDEESNADSDIVFELSQAIDFRNVTFSYLGRSNAPSLKKASFSIPVNQITAIVGESGSGKSTIAKLLLKFYEIEQGGIYIDNVNFRLIGHQRWRANCAAVLQDGFIFADSILHNITLGDDVYEFSHVCQAAMVAEIHTFIEDLPLGYATKIGNDGMGLSKGQQQRILIARAVLRNPGFLILDEATNALDATTERKIVENLKYFLTDRTVLIIAHRLSTIKSADQIIVMKNGYVLETGTHFTLSKINGEYASLLANFENE